MNSKHLSDSRNLKHPDQSPKQSHEMWAALGTILAVLVIVLILLTFVGVGGAEGAVFT